MRIVCFGDSNTYGHDPRSLIGERYTARWPELLGGHPDWAVENAGRNGREVPGRHERPPALAGGLPDVFLVMLGSNDLLQGRTPEAVEARMEGFLRGLLTQRGLEADRVLLAAPPPLRPGAWVLDEALPARSLELGRRFRALAGRLGVPFVDTAPWQLPLAFDGVHLTEEGHRLLARHMAQALEALFSK